MQSKKIDHFIKQNRILNKKTKFKKNDTKTF